MYAGHIWINPRNMKEINSLYYKILKSAVGAVLNIRQSYAEIILGLPPLHILNEVNKIKHFLKINMTQMMEDRLRQLITSQLQEDHVTQISHSMRQFLNTSDGNFRTIPTL